MSASRLRLDRTILFCAAPGCANSGELSNGSWRPRASAAQWFIVRMAEKHFSCRRLSTSANFTELDGPVCGHQCAHRLLEQFLCDTRIPATSTDASPLKPGRPSPHYLVRDDQAAASLHNPRLRGSHAANSLLNPPRPRPPSRRNKRVNS